MALLHLNRLTQKARTLYPSLIRVAISHRTGTVPVSEESVVIVASSPHRRDALEAVGWMIDELKATVPIWKNEIYEDGSMWKENCECGHARKTPVEGGKDNGQVPRPTEQELVDKEGRSGHLHGHTLSHSHAQ